MSLTQRSYWTHYAACYVCTLLNIFEAVACHPLFSIKKQDNKKAEIALARTRIVLGWVTRRIDQSRFPDQQRHSDRATPLKKTTLISFLGSFSTPTTRIIIFAHTPSTSRINKGVCCSPVSSSRAQSSLEQRLSSRLENWPTNKRNRIYFPPRWLFISLQPHSLSANHSFSHSICGNQSPQWAVNISPQ